MVLLVPAAGAKVWTTVYRYDEVTPLGAVDPNRPAVYRDIMVGTRLAIVISSDAATPWPGVLASSWDDWIYGELTARDYNSKTLSYEGSCLPAAGTKSFVRVSRDAAKVGLQFGFGAGSIPAPGEWFIVDYHARQVGACTLRLYGLPVRLDSPAETLSFTHVDSRDFNGDAIVDFRDFALLAGHWNPQEYLEPDSPQGMFDLDSDGKIGPGDLALFSEYWLEQTDCRPPAADPNTSSAGSP